MQENITLILDKIREADLVLTGIGEKFIPGENREKLERAYRNLAGCLEGKNYFVITTCDDGLIRQMGFREGRVVCPLMAEKDDQAATDWDMYMKWLQGTLHKKLLVLELGVGLICPDVIRFPFEKAVFYNQKAELVRVHNKLFQLPVELHGRGISIREDAVDLFACVKNEKSV